MGPPVSDPAIVFIVLKTICAPRELMNGHKIFLRPSESQHWPGSCRNNWLNKVNALRGGSERDGNVFDTINLGCPCAVRMNVSIFFYSINCKKRFKERSHIMNMHAELSETPSPTGY